jgi:hypothetical protein
MKVIVGLKFLFGIPLLRPAFIPSLYSEKKPFGQGTSLQTSQIKGCQNNSWR